MKLYESRTFFFCICTVPRTEACPGLFGALMTPIIITEEGFPGKNDTFQKDFILGCSK